MKKSLKLVAILAIVCVFVGCLVGCKKVKPQYGEKYYLCYCDVMMETSWLEFDQKKWSNEMRMSGKYKISGKKIKLYLDKEVAYEGVIGDGEITLTEGDASMKNNRQNELKVIVNGEPDLSLVPESLMDAFIAAIVEEIGKLNKTNGS